MRMTLRRYNKYFANKEIEDVINEARVGLKYSSRDIRESRIQYMQNQVLKYGDNVIEALFSPRVVAIDYPRSLLLGMINEKIEDRKMVKKRQVYYAEISKYHHLTEKLLEKKDGEAQARVDYLYSLNRILNYLKETLISYV